MLDDMAITGPVSSTGNVGGQARVGSWTVPGYTEVKRLGSGGFGDVVLARHDASGTQVAIKYLKAELLADPEFAESFRGEAAVLASLDDPNVVRLHEYVESPSGAAIVMELVDGVSLRQILKRQGATTPEAALVVLHGSLLGLAAAHARGVVHRDYKPDNVLIGGDGASKLTDFGIAARAWDRPMPAGTLIYAPPEQFAGGPASPATDVYAATATFFECLTGRPPFRGNTAEALLYQHMSHPVPVDAVPEPVRPLVAAGLAKQPEDRPADAAMFVASLSSIAAGAYGPDWHERGRSHLGEAAVLLAALWPSGAAPAVQGTTVARTPLGHRKRRSRPRRPGAIKAAIAAGTAIVVAAAGTFLASALTRSHSAALPTVTGVSPASGSTAGGTAVTITGTGLAGASAVRFGGVAGTITADSATLITVTSPPSASIVPITAGLSTRTTGAGTVDVTVTTKAGTSHPTAADHYTYTAHDTYTALRPAIITVSPNIGNTAGGTTLTVIGTGLADASAVRFGGVAGTILADAATQIIVASPPGTGTVPITVTTPGGTSKTTASGDYTYTKRPEIGQSISSTAPASGTAGGNSTYAAAPQVQQTIITPQRPTPTPTGPPPTTPAPRGPAPAGAAWTAAEGSLPHGDVSGGFSAMTCPSTSACVAVGTSSDSSGDGEAMMATGLGSSWTDATVPLPSGGSDPILGGVACPSASGCVAVGEYTDASGDQHGLLLTGSGSSWTATAAPLPANASAPADPDAAPVNLYSVACASASQCTAVGLYTDSSGYQQGLLLTGSGSSWTATEAPLPAGTDLNYYPYVSLFAVTCPSASQCVAVGDYDTKSGQNGLLLTGSGSSWTALQEPGFLNAVTCPSATACVAVGGAIVTGSGSSWTATTSPLPASDLNPELTAVTCRSASSCVAVGSYQVSSSSGGSLPLIVTGSGSSWTAVNAPLVAGGPSVPVEALDTVSCPAASSCVAIGTFADASNKAQILLMSESGSSWSAAEGPLPSNAAPFSATGKSALSPPHAVSLICLSTSDCVAVGAYTDTAPLTEPLLLSGPDTVG